MANTIDINGINITDLQEVLDNLIDGNKLIYGSDINLEQNSPDGQRINIDAQAIQDIKELIVSVYNSFNPDVAVGRSLDARCAINNIFRKSATYTYTNISIIVSEALNLVGLDDTTTDTPASEIPSSVYTIKDDAENEFVLVDSQSFVAAGTYSVSFRAKNIGQVITTINTITTPINIVRGIVSVNNPSSATITGTDEETDAALRVRRQALISLYSQGFKDSMLAGLLSINEVQDAKVYENTTNSTDSDGIPAHSYWIIVLGGSDEDVAEMIYEKRSGGTGMKGSESVNVEEIDGGEFEINFDRAVNEDLYIYFRAENLVSSDVIDFDYVKQQLVENFNFKISEIANKSNIEVFIKELLPDAYIKDCQVSNDGISYFDTLETSSKQNRFVLDTTRIDANYV